MCFEDSMSVVSNAPCGSTDALLPASLPALSVEQLFSCRLLRWLQMTTFSYRSLSDSALAQPSLQEPRSAERAEGAELEVVKSKGKRLMSIHKVAAHTTTCCVLHEASMLVYNACIRRAAAYKRHASYCAGACLCMVFVSEARLQLACTGIQLVYKDLTYACWRCLEPTLGIWKCDGKLLGADFLSLRQWEDAAKQFTLALKLATEPSETASLLCERSIAYARCALTSSHLCHLSYQSRRPPAFCWSCQQYVI